MLVESKHESGQLAAWLADAGLALRPFMGPRSGRGRLSVVLLGSGNEQEAALTLATLLDSSFQDFRVELPAGMLKQGTEIGNWLAGDDRFSDESVFAQHVAQSETVLVLPAGLLLTKYSIEAIYEALQQPGISVVRTVVPGRPQALEFWDAQFLRNEGFEQAEAAARRAGAERWIDGAALGLHFVGEPAPKVFFRRGAAERHIVDVNVLPGPPKQAKGSRKGAKHYARAIVRRLKALGTRAGGTATRG